MKSKIVCKYCDSDFTKKNGKTHNNKQRYSCKLCKKTFIIKSVLKKQAREVHWFKQWIVEAYNVRQLTEQSKHSASKIKKIIKLNILKDPEVKCDLNDTKGIMLDGTFIYKRICLFVVMDAIKHTVVGGEYPLREFCSTEVVCFLEKLKKKGLIPKYAVTDGNPHVIKALSIVYPHIIVQRCLTHIQRQCLAWCRQRPVRDDAKELRYISKMIPYISSIEEKEEWIKSFKEWKSRYKKSFTSRDAKDRIVGDIIRAASVLENALPNMFHYLDDNSIPKSTSCLEGYFSRLKHKYFAHRGLSPEKRTQYFKWFNHYCPK
jgi:hypothetical protein